MRILKHLLIRLLILKLLLEQWLIVRNYFLIIFLLNFLEIFENHSKNAEELDDDDFVNNIDNKVISINQKEPEKKKGCC